MRHCDGRKLMIFVFFSHKHVNSECKQGVSGRAAELRFITRLVRVRGDTNETIRNPSKAKKNTF